ncbi:MAG: YdeI/OmpD-associated family protein [Propionibacteriaceae bacterium]
MRDVGTPEQPAVRFDGGDEFRAWLLDNHADGLWVALAKKHVPDPRAAAFWAASAPSYRRVAMHWVVSAKQEATRDRRMAQLVEDSVEGRLIPSQRYGAEPGWLARARARDAAG